MKEDSHERNNVERKNDDEKFNIEGLEKLIETKYENQYTDKATHDNGSNISAQITNPSPKVSQSQLGATEEGKQFLKKFTDKEYLKENHEDFMFLIKDNSTGVVYDIRKQSTDLILKEETKKLTKLNVLTDTKPWSEWWNEKNERNLNLISAAEKGDLYKVEELLDVGKYGDMVADINAKGLDDFTPLHQAASEEHASVVKLLLSKGAEVNLLSVFLRTPLHLACCRGNLEIIQLITESKADINVKDKDGNTPTHILSEFSHTGALSWLLKKEPDLTIKNGCGADII